MEYTIEKKTTSHEGHLKLEKFYSSLKLNLCMFLLNIAFVVWENDFTDILWRIWPLIFQGTLKYAFNCPNYLRIEGGG